MDIYFNSTRQYLLAMIRYISKSLPKSMIQILTYLEDLQLDDIPSNIYEGFNFYNQIYQSRQKEWPAAQWGVNAIHSMIYYRYATSDLNSMDYWVNQYLKNTQKILIVAQNSFLEYKKYQYTNIFAPERPYNLDFVSEQVYNAAFDIHIKRHWEDLPMLADMASDYGCEDNEILSYMRNVNLHKYLKVHCWVIELILRAGINKSAQMIDSWYSGPNYMGR